MITRQYLLDLLCGNILSFWLDRMQDRERGGFYGRICGDGRLEPAADKGAVLNARILWAFAAAYRATGRPEYLAAAERARDYFLDRFLDRANGGVYWSLDCDGRPKDTKKQSYAIGFAIYGLSEMHRACGCRRSLRAAIELYHCLETHALDRQWGGYTEALTADWQPIGDMRLSDKDENGAKTMNTHLHIIEPYTNLYRVWPDKALRESIICLLRIFREKLYNPATHHLDLFFTADWQGRRDIHSYGHDIEAAWLINETVDTLARSGKSGNTGDCENTENTGNTDFREFSAMARAIARAADEGLRPDGAMVHELSVSTGAMDEDLHWWVQCENIIGHYDLYRRTGDGRALDIAERCMAFTEAHLIDRRDGEWHWSVDKSLNVNTADDKAGFWKCPYHNTRMCTELLAMLEAGTESPE